MTFRITSVNVGDTITFKIENYFIYVVSISDE